MAVICMLYLILQFQSHRITDAKKNHLGLQWTQNNSELELRHSKRGREHGKGKGEKDGKESV
jgi:hypothetical protein